MKGNGSAPLPTLELIDVRAAYGRIEVLHGVDLVVNPGEVVALLGPNGAGKSTTLRVASGRMTPTGGCVHVAGNHVNGAPSPRLARAGVCSIPEGRGIFPNLTVTDNLLMDTYSTDLSHAEVEGRVFDLFPRLGERRTQLAGTMSGGEQQMLSMARAVVADAGLLLLDEISMGLAPRIVQDLYEVVTRLAGAGVSILVVEQFARVALPVADRAGIMTHGRVQVFGAPNEIEAALEDVYMGAAL